MNIKEIKSLATNTITFERGIDYFEKGLIGNYLTNFESGKLLINARVNGNNKKIYDVDAVINEDGEVDSFSCTCEAFFSYNGACKHVIAVLLNYYYDKENKIAKENVINKPKSDTLASKMILTYTNKGINNFVIETLQEKVNLVPKIELDYYNKMLMSFSIGHEKLYVIKNLTKFYEDIKSNNIVEYGKKLTLIHNLNSFNEQSKPLVKFLINTFYEYNFYTSSSYYSHRIDPKYLIISPRSLDNFFDIYINKEIEFIYRGKNLLITLIDKNPEIILSIENKENDLYEISVNFDTATILKGVNCNYILISNKLYKLGEDFSNHVGMFIQTMMEKGSSLKIAKNDMSAFYVNVLNEIRDYIKINVDEKILEEFIPVPLISKFYIDMPETNLVTGNLKFTYDNYEFDAFDEVKNSDIYRNTKEELIAKQIVIKYFEYYDKINKQLVIEENDMIYNLYKEGLDEITKYIDIYATDKFKNIIRKPPTVNIGVKLNNNLLDININTEDFPLDELYDILSLYKKNKKFHRLKDGSFVNLEDNSLSELLDITDGLDLSKKDLENGEVSVPKYRALYLDNILKNSEQINSERDVSFKEIVRDIKNVDDTTFEIPDNLKSILRNYQKTGFRWLMTMSYYGFGGILADDMGLGKTLQVITLIQSYVNKNQERLPSFVVCPASLVLNWEIEINHFAPNIKAIPIIGNQEQRKSLIDTLNSYDIIITSYDYLKRDIDFYLDKEFMYHIIDEAQYIKNHNTLNAKSVKRINSYCRLALTGTPIENSLAEIWSIFDFIMPGYLYSYKKFYEQYELQIVKNEDEKTLNTLKKLVTPFVLRRLKRDVLKELPDKTESVMYTVLEGEQKKLYLANLALIKQELNEKFETSGFNNSKLYILSMLTRLRQLCCDPSLYYSDYKGESAKLEMCLELVETSIDSGHKILLFSQFTSMLEILKNEFIKKGISHYVLEGSTKKEERKRLVDEFNKDDTKVFLISLKAGGTGLNLTGADVVIHYDPWWNISAQNQATDRAHRIGQKENVQVYKLITKDTIEEKILKLQENKLKLADSLIVEDDGVIARMSKEDILNLFEQN